MHIADKHWSDGSGASVQIPDSVTYIGTGVFKYCTSLTSVIWPKSLRIRTITFLGCTSLTSIGPMGSGASVQIPDSVTAIELSAFADCTLLTSVTIPDGVTVIDGYSFSWCTSLTSLTIRDSLVGMGYYTFYNCDSLANIYYSGTIEQWNAIYNVDICFPYYSIGRYVIYCTNGTITKDGTVTYN